MRTSDRYFTADTFRFLAELRSHNNRDWFLSNKPRYEEVAREPMLRFVSDFGPALRKIAPGFVADPRPVGGSMFRINRDTRFAKDKTPYKTNLAAKFPFGGGCDDGANSLGYYLHLEPGGTFAAAGLWRPDGSTLARVRKAIADDSAGWKAVRKAKIPLVGDALVRPPKGFDPEHPFIDDIKRKDFVTTVAMPDRVVTGPGFFAAYVEACRSMSPLVRFLVGVLEKEK